MKKQSIKNLAFVAVAGTIVSSCTLLKDLEYTVTPSPLEMHGDSVIVKIDIVFPEKSINKKASAEITPMYGETALKPVTVVGEKATANGSTIQWKAGGKVSYEDVVAYKPSMENADLNIGAIVSKKGKVKDEVGPFKIADATIITPLLVNKDFKVILAEDRFERITPQSTFAQINYAKGKSVVVSKELKEDDITEYQDWLAMANTNPKVAITSVNIVGFASPEGEEDKNGTLSTDRSGSAAESFKGIATKAENTSAAEMTCKVSASGSDYPGFKKALLADEKIDEDEKQLIIRVLDMNAGNPDKIEEELRNMRKTFSYLDKEIFPLLRRSEITTNYDLTGFSDEEMKANSVSNPDTLDLEELLFCAALYTDLGEKLRVYKIAESRYPEDYRPSNNVGAVLYMMNKVSEAKAKFEKAAGIKDNPISSNNLGAVAGVEGDRSKSLGLLNQAGGESEVKYNKGILNIQDGDYSDAVSNLGSDASFNKALAEMLNGSASSVSGIIGNSDDADSGQGYYLKAVAAARQDQMSEVVSNLKSAIAKDGKFKAMAAKDREFLKYFENAGFTAIVK
ncbi:MAG: tetratricopeptide (TPR) repeat protein [Flavobacteriaceae bacterium]|jgi:tetratricopeptide (TPR) repeat protein